MTNYHPSELLDRLRGMSREDSVAALDRAFRRRFLDYSEHRHDAVDLEIGVAWSHVLDFAWRRLSLDRIKTDEHLRNVLWRIFRYMLRIEQRSRGQWAKSVEFHFEADNEGILDRPLQDAEPSTPSDGRLRRDHPALGSCRVDLSAAFDVISERQRIALVHRVVQGLSQIDSASIMTLDRRQVEQATTKGVRQLRRLMNGVFTRGGKVVRRFVPDMSIPEGHRWEIVA